MAELNAELDLFSLKLQRAALLKRHFCIKRGDYERRRARSAAPVPSKEVGAARTLAGHGEAAGAKVKPHRIARVAARTCVAKGLLETGVDMPSIVCLSRRCGRGDKGSLSARPQSKKPSVAPVTNFTKVAVNFEELSGNDAAAIWDDLETMASDGEASTEAEFSESTSCLTPRSNAGSQSAPVVATETMEHEPQQDGQADEVACEVEEKDEFKMEETKTMLEQAEADAVVAEVQRPAVAAAEACRAATKMAAAAPRAAAVPTNLMDGAWAMLMEGGAEVTTYIGTADLHDEEDDDDEWNLLA